ncbi:myrosinase 1-like, partial [Aricia agestis]|uniref:myrosinase 1-like n=1 Tax=Aricia agestis TaxID=91739 RepID=UPI001C208B8D
NTFVISFYRIIFSVGKAQDFPAGFKFGVATAAYQVEGAWNISGRASSIWDEFVHSRPQATADHSTGDVACDSFHLWRRDIDMVAELGVDFYRFSISWTRLYPNGFTNYLNEDGKRYYEDLIDTLLNRGIEPLVTLYHWDLPQKFQDLGGWTNPLVVEWFAEYARAVFTLFADRVHTWITINEPIALCDMVYHVGSHAPGILSPGVGNYICMKNVMLAHAKAWRIFDEEFRSKHYGRIAICNMHLAYEPASDEETEAAELARQLFVGVYTHPIYSAAGGWPPKIEKIISDRSLKDGYNYSRLPAFTTAEKDLIRGTYDFYAMNYYTGRLVRKAKIADKYGIWPLEASTDLEVIVYPDPKWKMSDSYWLYVYPEGIRHQLNWIGKNYGNQAIIITENGYSDSKMDLNDKERVQYHRGHLKQVLLSIYEDDVNVTGYTAWSLMDNFEWNSGYTQRFGLYAVDFTSPLRTRTPRASALYYGAVVRQRLLDPVYDNPYQTSRASNIVIHTSVNLFITLINLMYC